MSCKLNTDTFDYHNGLALLDGWNVPINQIIAISEPRLKMDSVQTDEGDRKWTIHTDSYGHEFLYEHNSTTAIICRQLNFSVDRQFLIHGKEQPITVKFSGYLKMAAAEGAATITAISGSSDDYHIEEFYNIVRRAFKNDSDRLGWDSDSNIELFDELFRDWTLDNSLN